MKKFELDFHFNVLVEAREKLIESCKTSLSHRL